MQTSSTATVDEQAWYDEFIDNTPEIHQLFVKRLLWEEIQTFLKESEVDFIRREVGTLFIQENEDLMNELKALIDILHSYRSQNERYTNRFDTSRSTLNGVGTFRLLRDNIHSLASTLQERAREYGKANIDEIFETPRERYVYNYVINPTIPSRSQTPRPSSRSSTEGSLVSSSSSSHSSCSKNDFEISEMKDQLNFFQIDTIVVPLREALESEKSAILDDIDYIRECLEEEYRFEREAQQLRPPSAKEMRSLEQKLSSTVQQEEMKLETERLIQKLPTSATAIKQKIPKLKPVESATTTTVATDLRPSSKQRVSRKEGSRIVSRLRATVEASRDIAKETSSISRPIKELNKVTLEWSNK